MNNTIYLSLEMMLFLSYNLIITNSYFSSIRAGREDVEICSGLVSQNKVTGEGSVHRKPQNLHKFAYSQFGFQYWSLSLAGDTARLPLHLSRPHEPHCEYPFCVFLSLCLYCSWYWKFFVYFIVCV